jgi:4-amino-4-deoxy-L-arabinose transferase-like glycosyltransferase
MASGFRAVIWPDDRVRRFLHILLLLYVFKEILTAILMPPFTGHDEVAHFSYIRTVATEHRLPKIPDLAEWRILQEQGDTAGARATGDFFDSDLYTYADYVLDWWHPRPGDALFGVYTERNPVYAVNYLNEAFPSGWQYAANHPPLFYVISTPVYWATDNMSLANQMRLLRMIAIPFGLLAVVGTYLIARTLFPGSGFVTVTATAFVALETQISYEAAMINNDILVVGFAAMLIALLLIGMRDRFPWRITIAIGVLFGLMLLSKGTSVVFAGTIALMMITGLGWKNWRAWLPKGFATAGIGFLMASPWYIYLYRTYGNLSALPQIKKLQYLWTYQHSPRPSPWKLLFNERFAVTRWNETWGEFGWRKVPLTHTLLWIIAIPCAISLIGLIVYTVKLIRARKSPRVAGSVSAPVRWQVWGMVGLFATALLGYAAVIQFGLNFALTQARYFFPMIAPTAVLLMVGLREITPIRGRSYVQVGVVTGLIALNIYIFAAYVIPYWYVIDLLVR